MVKLTSWVRPKDAPLWMRPLALHIGPYEDVLRTSRPFSGMSSERPRGVIWQLTLVDTSKQKIKIYHNCIAYYFFFFEGCFCFLTFPCFHKHIKFGQKIVTKKPKQKIET